MGEKSLKLVSFTMETGNDVYEFGIPIEQVYEITRTAKTTKLPNSPSFMEGVVNLRGNIVPIIDLKKRCGLGVTIPKDTTRIIIIQINKQKCGVIVDDVLEIIPIAAEDIEDAPAMAGGQKANYIIGIGKVGERLVIALDMDKILTESEEIDLLAAV